MPRGNPFLEIAYEKVELVCKKWNSKKSTVNYLLLIKRYLYKKVLPFISSLYISKEIRNIR